MHKLLIVGSDEIYSIENFYIKYLREFGVDISLFPAQRIFHEYYKKSILNKVFFKSGLSSIYKKINEQFKAAVENYRPDAIWVFKGMEIFPESLQWAKGKRIRLINYNPDNPFIFSGKGSGNSNVTLSIPLYDLHFTYHHEVKEKLEKSFQIPVAILDFGFDDNEMLYKECCSQDEIKKLCFLGNPDKRRVAFIDALSSKGVGIDIYGNDWSKYLNKRNISIFEPAYGIEQWKVLRRYRAQLNLMRVHNDNSHNMRSFEVPGIGGIMVAPDTIDHQTFFENGKEVFLYNNVDDCMATVNKLIDLQEAEADIIRTAARNRSKISGYSYEARARQALHDIESLFTFKPHQHAV